MSVGPWLDDEPSPYEEHQPPVTIAGFAPRTPPNPACCFDPRVLCPACAADALTTHKLNTNAVRKRQEEARIVREYIRNHCRDRQRELDYDDDDMDPPALTDMIANDRRREMTEMRATLNERRHTVPKATPTVWDRRPDLSMD